MRYLLFVGLFGLLGLSARAQTITVSNYLNPDGPIARGSLALIEPTGDETFTDEESNDPVSAPTTLGGVMVLIDGVPQRIQSVAPKKVVVLVGRTGGASRSLELRTKSNVTHRTAIKVVSVAPGIPVQSTGNDSEGLYPAGLYTLNPNAAPPTLLPITSAPIPVGPVTNQTVVLLQVVGLRPGRSTKGISVRLNGIQCNVTAVESSFFPGQEAVSFQIPFFLADNGVMDLIVTVDGRSSNPARLNLGTAAGLTAK